MKLKTGIFGQKGEVQSEKPFMGEVWIFSRTTHFWNCTIYM